MPRGLNVHFGNYSARNEQNLVEDLVIEAIKMHGVDLFYLPRLVEHRDDVFREAELESFRHALMIEGYVRNVDGFEGEGDFLSKFGVQIRDQITFTLARRTFGEEISSVRSDVSRPREGDLVWFPMNKKLFRISFVEHEAVFYQLGTLYTWDVKCELFEYNNEFFATGIPEIDSRYVPLNNSNIGPLTDPTTINFDAEEDVQNTEFQNEATTSIDWSEKDPFSDTTTY